MKTVLLLVLAVVLAAPTGCSRQSSRSGLPASKPDIERLMEALHVRERTQLIMENSRKQTNTMFSEIVQKELPEASQDERAQAQVMIDEMIDDVEKDYPLDAVLQDMVPVYQRHLTKADCDELIAFYSSPVGQKVLREMPAITSETMQVSNSHLQPRLEAAIDKLKQKVELMVEEDRKKKNVAAKDQGATKN